MKLLTAKLPQSARVLDYVLTATLVKDATSRRVLMLRARNLESN